MKKFLPLLFIMSVIGAVRADIASTNYVDNKIATKEVLGAVKIGDNIDVNNGTISVPKAGEQQIGVVSILPESGLVINGDGELSLEVAGMYPSAPGGITGLESRILRYEDNGDALEETQFGLFDGLINVPRVALNPYANGGLSSFGLVALANKRWNEEQDAAPERYLNAAPTVEFMLNEMDGLVDSTLDPESSSAVANKAVYEALEEKQNTIIGHDEDGNELSNVFVVVNSDGVVTPAVDFKFFYEGNEVEANDRGKFVTGIGVSGENILVNTSDYTLPTATDKILGGVKIGSNIDVNNGTISVPTASWDEKDLSAVPGVVPVAGGYSDVEDYQGEDKNIIVPNIEFTQQLVRNYLTNSQEKINADEICYYEYKKASGEFVEECFDRTYVDGDGFVVIKDGEVVPVDVEESGTGFVSSIGIDMGADDKPHLYINKSGLPTATTSALGGVKASALVPVASDGAMSVRKATDAADGVAKLGEIPIKANGTSTGSAMIWIE